MVLDMVAPLIRGLTAGNKCFSHACSEMKLRDFGGDGEVCLIPSATVPPLFVTYPACYLFLFETRFAGSTCVIVSLSYLLFCKPDKFGIDSNHPQVFRR
jgi:hypothetical protein